MANSQDTQKTTSSFNKGEGDSLSTKIRGAVQAIKAAILTSQAKSAQMINHEQLSLYYGIGRYVSEHTRGKHWGSGAIRW